MSFSSTQAPLWESIEAEATQARDNWYIYALGCGGGLLVVLAVLSVLHRKGLLCGSSRMRRPSHAQPWRHWDWGSPRSRLPSLFDLLHVPGTKSRKPSGALNLESGLPAPAPATGHTLQVPAELLGQRLAAAAGAGETPYIISDRHTAVAPPPPPPGPPHESELHLGAGAIPK